MIAVLLGGSVWLYVRNGDSFLSVSRSSDSARSAAPHTPSVKGGSFRTSISFAGSTSATELPCSIRQSDVRKVLAYLAAKGKKSRADLGAVCRYYGVEAISVASP